MIFRKIMTGVAAVTVVAVSVSMVGVMWRVNRFADSIETVMHQPYRRWNSRNYACEVFMRDGKFDKFVLYRVLPENQENFESSTDGRVPDGLLE